MQIAKKYISKIYMCIYRQALFLRTLLALRSSAAPVSNDGSGNDRSVKLTYVFGICF
jgi:hypothetical protein